MLIDNISRYLHFMDVQQLPSEITPDRTVGTHPRSTGVPVVHHRMKDRWKTLKREDGPRLSEARSCTFH
jgi:hypothetical protein